MPRLPLNRSCFQSSKLLRVLWHVRGAARGESGGRIEVLSLRKSRGLLQGLLQKSASGAATGKGDSVNGRVASGIQSLIPGFQVC